ncbi:carboxymuconolactone decarboxylase family protein [Methanoplanus sp. FWC-SCC4]|uniref:Carboxymuconolactone decarboxylase family protein n=1 Tax=Methanochimaera problematica TaxID=2609417 RepID=A0AA97F9D8_9EURY|nr:carboxymuconolactone decarboxylase family protein [Methanoplanus sp. FWC-SCC4]WOF15280.1 carboxymuconolactone decarboxylase family protein [Methanoplanus sp. FWC-SCC4]
MADLNKDIAKIIAETYDTNKRVSEDDPEFWGSFLNFANQATKEGALPYKMKELIALAVAINDHCKFCISVHLKAAVDAGASRKEIMEAAYVAVLMGGGPSMAYLRYVIDGCDQFCTE